jgi:hypothetical protein
VKRETTAKPVRDTKGRLLSRGSDTLQGVLLHSLYATLISISILRERSSRIDSSGRNCQHFTWASGRSVRTQARDALERGGDGRVHRVLAMLHIVAVATCSRSAARLSARNCNSLFEIGGAFERTKLQYFSVCHGNAHPQSSIFYRELE